MVLQGTVFSAIGFSAGITGTAVSNFLLFMRKQFDPNFQVQVGLWRAAARCGALCVLDVCLMCALCVLDVCLMCA